MPKYGGYLCASPNAGRYRVGENGPDLTSGAVCEVFLAGRWVRGTVYHSKGRFDLGGMVAVEYPEEMCESYYLEVEEISGLSAAALCGLCTGMCVRLVW